jgi:hypothetical protein
LGFELHGQLKTQKDTAAHNPGYVEPSLRRRGEARMHFIRAFFLGEILAVHTIEDEMNFSKQFSVASFIFVASYRTSKYFQL